MSKDKTTVQTSKKTFDVLHALQELDGGRIEEVAAHVDLSPSTVYRHLNTLREMEYVRKDGDEYDLGLRFLTLGGRVQSQQPGFDLAKTKVDQLAAETNERSQFIVEEHDYRFYVYTQTGENAVQTDATIGKRGYLHASAAGKAILANLPEPRVREIIDHHGLPQVTEQTITDEGELFEELERIRGRGYAYNREESTQGLRALGSTITCQDGVVIGAISISGPAHRLKGERFESELPDLIMGVTNEIELRLEYS